MQRPSDILGKELLCYKRGVANMFPDYPLDFSTMLGDIGWFGRDGQFIRLFNCFEDGHRNNNGLPPNFDYLCIPDDMRVEIEEDLHSGEILCSTGTIIFEVTNPNDPLETVTQTRIIQPVDPLDPAPHGLIPQYPIAIHHPKEKWAFLMTQFPGKRRYIKPNDLIHPYIITHRESWFQLSCQRFHKLNRDDFIFVSGQVETRQWALGIAQRKESVFTLVGELSDKAERFDNEFPNNDCDARSGPERPKMREKLGKTMMTNPLQDQSIFLNFYKARSRLVGPAKISAMSGPHSLPGNHDQSGSTSMSTFIDPALEYILEMSECDVAVAGDIEIYHLLGVSPWPDDLASFLRELSPTVVCGTVNGTCYGRFALDGETSATNKAVSVRTRMEMFSGRRDERWLAKASVTSGPLSRCHSEPAFEHVPPFGVAVH